MTLVLPITVLKAGSYADADSTPVLADPTNAFGVRRLDSGATVVATGTAMTRSGVGRYSYTIASPVDGVTYEWWPRIVVDGQTFQPQRQSTYGPIATAPSYLTAADADAIAATLPAAVLAAYLAADSGAKTAALVQASADVDGAMRYQGRKYDLTQALEFPRAAYETLRDIAGLVGANVIPRGLADTVWDWDDSASAAIVPLKVKQAVVYQANAILDGTRAGRLDAQHDGLLQQSVGGLSEQYGKGGAGGISGLGGGPSPLCRQAAALMVTYRLRQGRVL